MKKSLLVLLLLLTSCSNEPLIDNNTTNQTSIEENIVKEELDSSFSDEEINENINEETTSYSNESNKFYSLGNHSIYINPSVQYDNLYINNLGNEGEHMNNIAIILVDLLKSKTDLTVYSNLNSLSLGKSVAESNSLKVDYHLALHSNGGKGTGSEAWTSTNKVSLAFSNSILKSLNEILPYNTRGIKNGSSSLYEVKNTNAYTCLLEILFHDEAKQASYLVNNQYKIAYSIFEGIVNYFMV